MLKIMLSYGSNEPDEPRLLLKVRVYFALRCLLTLFCIPSVYAPQSEVIGLTSSDTPIEVHRVFTPAPVPTVLLIGGLNGIDDGRVAAVQRQIQLLENISENEQKINLLAIPLANPNGDRYLRQVLTLLQQISERLV